MRTLRRHPDLQEGHCREALHPRRSCPRGGPSVCGSQPPGWIVRSSLSPTSPLYLPHTHPPTTRSPGLPRSIGPALGTAVHVLLMTPLYDKEIGPRGTQGHQGPQKKPVQPSVGQGPPPAQRRVPAVAAGPPGGPTGSDPHAVVAAVVGCSRAQGSVHGLTRSQAPDLGRMGPPWWTSFASSLWVPGALRRCALPLILGRCAAGLIVTGAMA